VGCVRAIESLFEVIKPGDGNCSVRRNFGKPSTVEAVKCRKPNIKFQPRKLWTIITELLAHASSLVFFFDLEVADFTFHRNVSKLLQDCTASYTRR
jgi:hypothetical protein